MQRRAFLKNTTLLAALGLTHPTLDATAAPTPGPAKPPPADFGPKYVNHAGAPPQKHLTYYNYESQAWFRKNNINLTTYRAGVAQKYPYWYPLAGPATGLSLVAESAQPWPHHRGVFFGCDRVNGGNYWQNALADGQILSQGFRLEDIGDTHAVFTDRCHWNKPGQDPIITDERRYELRILDERRYILDATLDLHPLTEITIQQTNHGLYGVRCAPDISATGGGTLESATGAKGAANIHGKRARWCTFYGKRAGLDITEGVAVLVPDKLPEPFGKSQWFARDYGNISPMPMLFIPRNKPIILPKGETLRLRYRVVAYAGTPKEAGLDGLWEDFAAKA